MLRRLWILALVFAGFPAAFLVVDPALARGARHAAMILDANTGAVLHNEDGDEQRHPASLTKMMTLYLTFETIDSGRLSISDKITISQEAASQAPSKLDLEPGEDILVSDAIRAVITKSANDVAVALAEKIGGSERNFVRLMNTRAKDIGMSKTHFENASGLPNNDQVTTARDMITLGLHLQDDFPAYYPLFATKAFSYNGATHRNHNTMLNGYEGIDGIKTGYTSASGFNLVSSLHRNGRHLVGAVFGGQSAATRNGEMRTLLTRLVTRASPQKTRKPAPSLIAKLKSAPKLAERPKPKDKPKIQVAAAPAPAAPAPPIVAIAAPQPMAVETAETVVTAEEQRVSSPVAGSVAETAPAPIDVFKVKRIMVAPRQGPKRPPPGADETTDMSPDDSIGATLNADTASLVPDEAAPFKVANSESTPADSLAQTFAAADMPAQSETVVPKSPAEAETAPVRLPSPLDDKIAMLGARDADPAASPAEDLPTPMPTVQKIPPVVKAAAPRPAAQPKPLAVKLAAPPSPALPTERGRAPSSLQAQAAQILPQRQNVAALVPATAPGSAAGRFEIQIGAYSSIDEAQRALTSAQSRAGQLLAGYASVTHPVQKEGRQVFRARFSGFDSTRAATTCTELRRQAIDCFVMTAE